MRRKNGRRCSSNVGESEGNALALEPPTVVVWRDEPFDETSIPSRCIIDDFFKEPVSTITSNAFDYCERSQEKSSFQPSPTFNHARSSSKSIRQPRNKELAQKQDIPCRRGKDGRTTSVFTPCIHCTSLIVRASPLLRN